MKKVKVKIRRLVKDELMRKGGWAGTLVYGASVYQAIRRLIPGGMAREKYLKSMKSEFRREELSGENHWSRMVHKGRMRLVSRAFSDMKHVGKDIEVAVMGNDWTDTQWRVLRDLTKRSDREGVVNVKERRRRSAEEAAKAGHSAARAGRGRRRSLAAV